MKAQIASIVLLLIGSVLFILDDIALLVVDYRITVSILYLGLLVGIYHLFMTQSDETP